MTMKVYLSGPIDFSSDESLSKCKDWRDFSEAKLAQNDIESINPMRGGIHLNAGQSFDDMIEPRAIVMRDMKDIIEADLMLVCFPKKIKKYAIGTIMEMIWAFVHDIPIILVDETESVKRHPWVGFVVTEFAQNIPAAIDRIVRFWR